MVPAKPPRKNSGINRGDVDVIQEHIYEDPDVFLASGIAEVQLKPTPRPRTKSQLCGSSNKMCEVVNNINTTPGKTNATGAADWTKPDATKSGILDINANVQKENSTHDIPLNIPEPEGFSKPDITPRTPSRSPVPAARKRISSVEVKEENPYVIPHQLSPAQTSLGIHPENDGSSGDSSSHTLEPRRLSGGTLCSNNDDKTTAIYETCASFGRSGPNKPPPLPLKQRNLPTSSLPSPDKPVSENYLQLRRKSNSLLLNFSETPLDSYDTPRPSQLYVDCSGGDRRQGLSPPHTSPRPSESLYDHFPPTPNMAVGEMKVETTRTHSVTWSPPVSLFRLTQPQVQHDWDIIFQFNADDIPELLKWLKKESNQSSILTSTLYNLSLEEEKAVFEQKVSNLKMARHLYSLLVEERRDTLDKGIQDFRDVSAKLEKVKKINKSMGIAGGTTTAVGGVAAVVGIALAPVTMGTSLIATAVGAGVMASAGGFGAHALKTNKKMVTRSAIEALVESHRSNIVDLEICLDFILSSMRELQRHDTERLRKAGAHPDAVRVAELSLHVSKNSMDHQGGGFLFHQGGMMSENLLKAFSSEFDLYFTEKKGQKLKKSEKSKFAGTINNLTKNLKAELDYLVKMKETLTWKKVL